MFKNAIILMAACFFLASCQGCFMLLAGAAGGAGTAAWLSGKLTQEVNVSFEKTIGAAKNGLRSMKLPIEKETVETDAAQIKSVYSDGRTVWVDVHRITESSSRIEVRVGMTGDKGAAEVVLKKIKRYL